MFRERILKPVHAISVHTLSVQNQPGEDDTDADQPSHLFLHARNVTYRFSARHRAKLAPESRKAGRAINDFYRIRYGGGLLTPGAMLDLHAEAVVFLTETVKPGDIVITHWPPALGLSAAYPLDAHAGTNRSVRNRTPDKTLHFPTNRRVLAVYQVVGAK